MTVFKRYILRVAGADICGRLVEVEVDGHGEPNGLIRFDDVRQASPSSATFPYACWWCYGTKPGTLEEWGPHIAADEPPAPYSEHLIVGRGAIQLMRENTGGPGGFVRRAKGSGE